MNDTGGVDVRDLLISFSKREDLSSSDSAECLKSCRGLLLLLL